MSEPSPNGAGTTRLSRFGVWGYCDECQQDSWVIAAERDYMDEPTSWSCGGGCDWDDDDE